MSFESQYKQEMNEIAPSEEQLSRIAAGVRERVSKKKKPIYMRIAAVSGAAAAVAVIAFAAIAITPRMKDMAFDAATGNGMNGGAAAPGNSADSELFDQSPWYSEAQEADGNLDGKKPGWEPPVGSIGTSSPSGADADQTPSDWQNVGSNGELLVKLDVDSCAVIADGKRYIYKSAEYVPYPEDAEFIETVTEEGLEIFVYFDENQLWILRQNDEPAEYFTR